MSEEILEFPLPPALRALYASVAKGGFGPGYGIPGAVGGFGPGDGIYAIGQGLDTFSDEIQLAPLEHYAETPGSQRFILPHDCWPKQVLPLCYWGDANYEFIDASTGRICRRDFSDNYPDDPNWQTILTRTELSLEDWLSRWLDGVLESPQS